MEQEPPEGERECGEYTEVNSPVSSLRNSTDSDRHTEEDSLESSPWNSANSDRLMEKEDEGKLSDEPVDRPVDETAVKLAEGHPPNYEPAETITVECLALVWESPPGGAWEEDRVVVHSFEDEMDHLC